MVPAIALVVGSIVLIFLLSGLRVIKQWERGIVLRFGRYASLLDPGLRYVIPIVDRMIPVDQRIVALDVAKQQAITRDNVPVHVDAVVFFRVTEPVDAVLRIRNYYAATSQISQTTLRSVVGQHNLDELLSDREKLNSTLREFIDTETDSWGVEVSLVEIKDVSLPESMQRAIARQAEAERERRAKIIHAEGELAASRSLTEAAQIMGEHEAALTLRYLQTLVEIAAEHNSTTIFPVPIDIFRAFVPALNRSGPATGKE